ncbi:MAG: acyloxyacyl hydrolase [Syntrophobacteraceae bacterium]
MIQAHKKKLGAQQRCRSTNKSRRDFCRASRSRLPEAYRPTAAYYRIPILTRNLRLTLLRLSTRNYTSWADLDGDFQFNLQASMGIEYFFRPTLAATVQARYLHISNAGIKSLRTG